MNIILFSFDVLNNSIKNANNNQTKTLNYKLYLSFRIT